MIKLTLLEGDAVYVSPELIVAAYDGGEATTLFIGGDEAYSVKESPEEVARKVLEYKVIFAQHQAYIRNEETYSYAHDASRALRVLAGLEESQ
ncbi:flagellar FlbD family protein [Paenibacillus sp. CAU 1782]